MEVSLKHTKQKKQIGFLKFQLEKYGWEILEEQSREFLGKPQWSHSDEIPNLVGTWQIRKKGRERIYKLDFTAHWDWKKNETQIFDCAQCQLRNSELKLELFKDTQLFLANNQSKWETDLEQFCKSLLEY